MQDSSTDFRRRFAKSVGNASRAMAIGQYYGGKGNLAKKIMPHIGKGQVYCEPYCGMASVFWHLPKPFPVEVLNDFDGEVVNLFRVMQDKQSFDELAHRLTWTPYSLDEFRRALAVDEAASSVDRAWSTFVKLNQGFSGKSKSEGDWGRVFGSSCGMAGTVNIWRKRIALLDYWHDRLMRVQLDNRCALEVIKYWDSPETVFYVDPPYAHDTRKSKDDYKVEQDDNHHKQLVETLLPLSGRVVLSGYATPIYAPLETAGWHRIDITTACHAAGRVRGTKMRGAGSALEHASRTETLWINRSPNGLVKDLFDGPMPNT